MSSSERLILNTMSCPIFAPLAICLKQNIQNNRIIRMIHAILEYLISAPSMLFVVKPTLSRCWCSTPTTSRKEHSKTTFLK